MRVVIDVSPLKSGHQYRGIGVYTKNLYKALTSLRDGNDYILTTKSVQANADVVHYPFFDFYFLSLPLYKKVPCAVTIHDTIPLVYKDQYPAGIKGAIKFRLQQMSLRGVKKILTDSTQSKNDIKHYLKQASDKVVTIPLAADDRFIVPKRSVIEKVKVKYGLQRPYLIYVGDINYNKNIIHLIKSFRRFSAELDLVLVSRALGKNIHESQTIHALIEELHLQQQAICLTTVPSEPLDDLQALYSGAEWLIQPSLYEGFGLPVLEAWGCGTPVISSTGGSLKELISDAAVSFNPNSSAEMEQAIASALAMTKSERKQMIQRGHKRASQFSWKETARQTAEVYEKIFHG